MWPILRLDEASLQAPFASPKIFPKATAVRISTASRFNLFSLVAIKVMKLKVVALQPGNFEKNLELVDKIESVAKRKGVTSAQLCLAWEIAQSEVSTGLSFRDVS